MSGNLIEAKAALTGCENKAQVMYVVECACENGRYNYRFGSTVSDNAIYADIDGHHDLASVLRFAERQLGRM